MSRRICSIVLVLILSVGLISCGNEELIVGEQVIQDLGYYSFGYISFTGTRNILFETQGDKPANITILTYGGNVSVELFQDPESSKTPLKEAIYSGEKLPTGKWEVKLEPGTYILRVTGKKHSGSVGVDYF